MRSPPFDLIVISEPALLDPRVLAERLLPHAPAGRVAIQLRAKSWDDAQRQTAARTLRTLTRDAGAYLLINGDPQLCADIDADGVQLPSAGPSVTQARAIVGERWIGASCHDHAQLDAATTAGADFALLSPWSDVPGKAPALGAARFAQLARATTLPVYALGGIDATQVGAAIACGARGVAAIRQAHEARDPGAWLDTMLNALTRSSADRRD